MSGISAQSPVRDRDTIYEYYAIAPNALSADAITVNFAGTASYVDLNAFGISGANTSSPFDTSVPATPASSTGAVTTSNANDLIFAAYRFSTDATPSAGSSWTAINASGGYYLSEDQIVSATQAGLVATASTADEDGGIVDAVQAASSSGTTAALTVVAGSTLDLISTTISGGTLSNAGTVDVTGGGTSTFNGVGVTNSGGTGTVTGPLALDGNGFSSRPFESTTSTSVTLTTANANDVIILDIVQNGTTVSSVSDTADLVWHQRAVAGSGSDTIYEYYAIAPNALSADAITVNFAGTASYVDLNAFGISGANTSSPFDTSVPATPASSTGAVTTSNANDLIFAAYRFSTDATPSAGSSWTAINASGGYYLSEDQIVSATQAGLVATASTADENGGIVDAVVQATAAAPTTAGALTVDAGSTLDLNNTTITGGTLTNSGTVDQTGGTSALNGVAATNYGLMEATSGTLTIDPSTVTNTGSLEAVGGGTLDLQGTSVTNTSGTVTVASGSTLDLNNATITAGTLSNAGTVDSTGNNALNAVAVTNSSLLETTSGTLTIDPGAVTNSGTIEATTGGTFDLNGISVSNNSGTVDVNKGSALNLSSTTITGGMLSNSGAVNLTGDSTSTLDGVSVSDEGASTGLALDGSGFFATSSPTLYVNPISLHVTSRASVTLTTTQPDDVIVLFVANEGAYLLNDGDDEYDADHLTWYAVGEAGVADNVPTAAGFYEFYAIAPQPLTDDVIGVAFNGPPTQIVLGAFAISGANTSAPFDTNASVPATPASSTGSVTTNNANDFIFAGYSFSSDANPGAGSGWTAINSSGYNFLSEYQIVSATQAGLVATASSGDENGGIVDAVVQASDTAAVMTIDAGSTLDLNNTTITGGVLTNAGAVDVTGGGTSTLNGVTVGTSSLALDGNAIFNEFGEAGALRLDSASVTLTTSHANDVIILDILQNETTVKSISDTADLNWQLRAVAGTAPQTIYEYYAIAPNALSADAITVNFSSQPTYVDLNAFGISDANTSSPFDSDVSAPATPATSTGSVTTSNANDFIFASYRFSSNSTSLYDQIPSAGPGWTAINANGDYYLSEYQIVSATQTGLVATASATEDEDGGIVDAVEQASAVPAGKLIIDVGSALDLVNTTIFGDVLTDAGTVNVTGVSSSTLNGVSVINTGGTVTVVSASTLDLIGTTISGGSLTNAGTVDVTGGGTSTFNGVGVTNSGGTGTVTGPLALDGNGFSSRPFESTTSTSVTLTTANANDVIILDIVQNGTTVSSVSDTADLVWHQRAVAGSGSQTDL